MGGDGSGRKPNEETIVSRMTEQRTPVGDDLWLPNYSGVQNAALKTSAPLGTGTGTGTETDPVFMALSGSLVITESDPKFMLLSGSLSPYALSGSLASYVPMSLSGSFVPMSLSGSFSKYALSGSLASYLPLTLSGSMPNYALSGSATITLGAHVSTSTDPHGATLTQTNIYFTSGSRTGDISVSGSLYVPNILFGTTSGAYTASNYTLGSLLVVYTP